MTDAPRRDGVGAGSPSAPTVFFLSDSTGITAETLGNTLLTQFPGRPLERRTIPFITTVEQAHEVVATIDQLAANGPRPIIFSTTVGNDIRAVLSRSHGHFFDLFGAHIGQLEQALNASASGVPGQAHGVGDAARYQSRMAAVEYAIEHDDGQSVPALERAELILIAPSRCGKTPTTMYLALQHAILAANFPLVEEDFTSLALPKPLLPFVHKCFGLTSLPVRLSQIRQERRPGSNYASLGQCTYELRNAEDMYRVNQVPYVNSASMSVEEISATVLQRMQLHH
ncbi:regulator of PEP synthase PpsR (kinase-PPPase family) [Arthrobacter globiformis]|uniref:pyruvate, water dikinase regulatory protein n=1 Tax=Arthrobacter globiformis TaxID=1665 RepID=UPI00277D8460|nr:pyruvate, water dikinase regulatory protein [Arthrobacter globiformis]MDQ1060837.1 regulator of PEP synthase PpsR (kinase-PPPase family) [Arthrobacter globiformis]